MSQIFTLIQPDKAHPPVVVFLSLRSDDTVSFQPKIATFGNSGASSSSAPTVTTQTWLCAPQGTAQLTTKNDLKSLKVTLQAIKPDEGKYVPFSPDQKYLKADDQKLAIDKSGTVFTLTMSGMAPTNMAMADVAFSLNSTPSPLQKFGPTFGVSQSTPTTFSLSDQLPAFLNFDFGTGSLVPNGRVANPELSTKLAITASNALGQCSTSFTLSVAAT